MEELILWDSNRSWKGKRSDKSACTKFARIRQLQRQDSKGGKRRGRQRRRIISSLSLSLRLFSSLCQSWAPSSNSDGNDGIGMRPAGGGGLPRRGRRRGRRWDQEGGSRKLVPFFPCCQPACSAARVICPLLHPSTKRWEYVIATAAVPGRLFDVLASSCWRASRAITPSQPIHQGSQPL